MATAGFHEVGTRDGGSDRAGHGDGCKSERDVFRAAKRSPITATSFLPPFSSSVPRLWDRVAVPAVKSNWGERKIWKRIAPNGSTAETRRYLAGMTELQRQGRDQRKRARPVGHVPAWGDAKWDPREKDPRDCKWDVVEAKVSVAAAKSAASEIPVIESKQSTFHEASLRFVPRKRHNSRFPVPPPKNGGVTVATDQPLVEFVIPDDLEKLASEAVVQQADEKKMRRRSTHRLSRRLTLTAVLSPIKEKSSRCLSPGKASQGQTSPMKRRLVNMMTPTRVFMSPAKHFRMSATPSKVIMEEPEPEVERRTSASSVADESKVAPDTPTTDAAMLMLDTSISLVFEQSTDEVLVEPQHETRRRLSLYRARRIERRSSGIQRLPPSDSQKTPLRRHSLVFSKSSTAESKVRRHTLAISNHGGEELKVPVTSPMEVPEEDAAVSAEDNNQLNEQVASPVQPGDRTVEVDAQTKLDIFSEDPIIPPNPSSIVYKASKSPPPPPQGPASPSLSSTSTSLESPCPTLQLEYTDFDGNNHGNLAQQDTTFAKEQTAAASAPENTVKSPVHSTPSSHQPDTFHKAASSGLPDSMGAVISCLCGPKQARATPAEQPARPVLLPQVKGNGQYPTGGNGATLSDATIDSATVNPQDFHGSMRSSSGESTGTVIITRPRRGDSTAPPIAHWSDGHFPLADPTTSESDEAEQQVSFNGEPGDGPDVLGVEHMPVGDIQNQAADKATETPSIKLISATANDDETSTICTVPALPATPPQPVESTIPTNTEVLDFSNLATPTQVTGFTPINGHSSLSPRSGSPQPDQICDTVTTPLVAENIQQVDETIAMEAGFSPLADGEVMVGMEIDTCEQGRLSIHDDSETEMLRNFVTRVKADRDAKAAEAARAKLKPRPQRRSGSMGMTSDSGSPVSRKEASVAASPGRMPLGDKDINQSPSPAKKRKAPDAKPAGPKTGSRLSKPDLDDMSPPRPKRRRKKMEVDNADSVFNPEFGRQGDAAEAAPRRSTRTRNARAPPPKPLAQPANAGVLSQIPVRLPGSLNLGAGDDAFGPAPGRRDETKDLAKVTNQNTRRNKAGAEMPRDVLARQASDPSWRLKELKSAVEARERALGEGMETGGGGEGDEKKGGGKGKGVRWANVLARFQGYDQTEPVVMKAVSAGLTETTVVALGDVDMVDAAAIAEAEAFEVIAPEVVSKAPAIKGKGKENMVTKDMLATSAAPQAANDKDDGKKPTAAPAARRTRASRLQPPTPRKVIASKAAAKNSTAASASGAGSVSPKKTSADKEVPLSKTGASGHGLRMATRRTKIASLGMAGNGTPAPKRRTGRSGI